MSNWKTDAEKHARDNFPSEVCGLVVIIKGRERYVNCKNIAVNPYDHFIINPLDYAKAEDLGEVVGVFHSHPYQTPYPSSADLTACENSKKIWYIYAVALNKWHEFEPTGYQAPLIGRSYAFGVHDCWTLVKDYYESVGIKLHILPYVNTDGYITTKITPEVSSIQSWTAQGYPWTKKRESTTTVRVKDGETIVIAGLITTEAIKANANAIKFQMFNPNEIVSKKHKMYNHFKMLSFKGF